MLLKLEIVLPRYASGGCLHPEDCSYLGQLASSQSRHEPWNYLGRHLNFLSIVFVNFLNL